MNPGPFLIIKTPFTCFYILCTNYIQKYQKYIYFLQLQQKPKNIFTICYSLHSSFSLLSCILLIVILFHFTNTEALLDNHTVELGAQDKETCFEGCWTRLEEASPLFPGSLILNPKSLLWGKFSYYNTLDLES
jgi:hypothetical protein